jgi:hypothetical protein
LDDPEWRQTASELSKKVRQARTPEARAEAQEALKEHLEGKPKEVSRKGAEDAEE